MSCDIKYIGMDVHKEAMVIAVLNEQWEAGHGIDCRNQSQQHLAVHPRSAGRAACHLGRGDLGGLAVRSAASPTWREVLVCDPRRNALMKEGSKSDKVDARKLADLLRTGMLRAVYHGEHGLRTLRELGRSYRTISKDLKRVRNRMKALYRGWGIPVQVPRSMLRAIGNSGCRRSSMPACAGVPSCSISSWMDCRRCGEPCVPSYWRRAGNIRPRNCCVRFPASVRFAAARLMALMQTPHRFRSKRQLLDL